MAVGALDKCMEINFGYGEKFEEGIMAMGALALSMVGIVSLAPVLANIFKTDSWTCVCSIRGRPCNVCYYITSK